ncbi:MAG: hypothetical protein ACRDF4_01570, partial [Rhabdochlamydiaceae bacterium]
IQSVFTSEELAAFRMRVCTELLPKLPDVRRTWQSNLNSETPDEYMEPLLASFSVLKQEFADDPVILRNIDHEIMEAKEWIAENMADDSETDRPVRTLGGVESLVPQPPQSRSIFDDIDE